MRLAPHIAACALLIGCTAEQTPELPLARIPQDTEPPAPIPEPPSDPEPPAPDVPARPATEAVRGMPFTRVDETRWTGAHDCCVWAADMAMAPDGSVAVVAVENATPKRDHLTVYDRHGRERWSRSDTDLGHALGWLPDGSLIVAGSRGEHGSNQLRVGALTSSGRPRWTHVHEDPSLHWSSGSDVAVDAAGDIVVAGQLRRHGERPHLLLQKLDRRGRVRWSVEGEWHSTTPRLAVHRDGIFVIGGDSHPWVARFDEDGTFDWRVGLPPLDQRATDVLVEDTHVFVSSKAYGLWSEQVSYLHRVGTDGGHHFSRVLPSPEGFALSVEALSFADDGAILFTGTLGVHMQPVSQIVVGSVARDARAVGWWERFDADGPVLESGTAVAPTPSGGLLLFATSGEDDGFSAWLQRLEPDSSPISSPE